MKKILSILASLALIAGAIVGMQSTKQLQLQWDPMPTTEAWQSVRLYDVSATPEVLLGTTPCTVGTPMSCPTSIVIVIQKKAYKIVARSFDGNWESLDSNQVAVLGPPASPTNLKK